MTDLVIYRADGTLVEDPGEDLLRAARHALQIWRKDVGVRTIHFHEWKPVSVYKPSEEGHAIVPVAPLRAYWIYNPDYRR